MQTLVKTEDWTNSDWFKEWLRLAHDKPKQPGIGFWYWDNVELKWKFHKDINN